MNRQSGKNLRGLIISLGCALLTAGILLSNRFTSTADDRQVQTQHSAVSDLSARQRDYHAQSIPPVTTADELSQLLLQVIHDAGQDAHVTTASDVELNAVTELFARTVARNREFDVLRDAWAKWQMEFLAIPFNDGELWLLQEVPHARRGRGVYVFREYPTSSIFLQAPHSGFDQHTGEIVAQLFSEHRFIGAAWNSVHRQHVDLAHVDRTWFQALTRAVGQSIPGLLVAQIHGFDERKRESAVGRNATLIVSNGTMSPPPWFLPSALAFRRQFVDKNIAIFPFDTSELGATTNTQARILRILPEVSFLHVECNREFRTSVSNDAAARNELAQCFDQFVRNRIEDDSL